MDFVTVSTGLILPYWMGLPIRYIHGYEEEVPRWLIDELFPNEPEENYMMHCPECDHKMIVKK